MARFSNKAYRYLSKLHRDKSFMFADRNEVIDFLIKQDLPLFENVIDFQMEFSGLELTISNQPSSTFNTCLFSPANPQLITDTDLFIINGQYYFHCGDHEAAQFWFVLSEKGELCTYNEHTDSVNVIFSSFDKFIEAYALKDILSNKKWYEHPPYYNLTDSERFNILTNDFIQLISASDQYSKWLLKDGLLVHQGTWYDRAAYSLHFYSDAKEKCETFAQSLKEKQIIK